MATPKLLERYLADSGAQASICPRTAALTRILAASKPGCTALHITGADAELAFWLHDGLDVLSRFVCVTGDRFAIANRLHAQFESDLRITVTRQEPQRFLADVVKNHHFDLIVIEGTPAPEHITAFVQALHPGGILLISAPEPTACEPFYAAQERLQIRTSHPTPGEAWLAVRLQPNEPPKRRVGRSGKLRAER